MRWRTLHRKRRQRLNRESWRFGEKLAAMARKYKRMRKLARKGGT